MKSMFNFKKPWIWMILAVLVVAVVAAVCLLIRRPIVTEVSPDLDACIVSTLRDQHYSDHTEGKYPAVAYTTLHVEEKKNTVTVYGVMMYSEYTCTTRNKLEVWGSANTAFAITAKKVDGGYKLVECWWPKSGKDYVSSIEEKFPNRVQDNAVNAQQYVAVHTAACQTQAAQNIAPADKYAVLQSEAGNVRLAYCPNNAYSYILFGAGYNTDGTYEVADGKVVFIFGNCRLTFAVDGDTYVYNHKESANVPASWGTIGDITYFEDGVVFKPETGEAPKPVVPENTAPVGPTVTATTPNWMTETELRDLFGQYVPSSYFDSGDSKYLPVRPIESRGQLDRLLADYVATWPDLTVENFAQYDEAFFKDNYILMTYYRDGLAACEPAVDSYVYVQDGMSLWLSVRLEVQKPVMGDTVVGQWLLFSGIAKEDYKKATSLEAYVENVVTVENTSTASHGLSFTGTVTQVEGHAMLMSCDSVPQFSSGVWVELGDTRLAPQVGDTYTVTYEDIVMPSLPPRITAITITKP